MDQNSEFYECFDELDKLRSEYYKIEEAANVNIIKSVSELAQNQLLCLEAINDFFENFAKSTVKERLEDDEKSILMPDHSSVVNLIGLTKTALEICKESDRKKNDFEFDAKFTDEKANLKRLLQSELNSRDFHRNFRKVVRYCNNTTPQTQELGDSTVNTIISEDVLTSSPICY